MPAWRCWGALAVVLVVGPVLGGCAAVRGGPDRLYPVAEEVTWARDALDGVGGSGGLVARYYAVDPRSLTAAAERMYYRNEIVARRMYIIDVQYSAYEAELTSDRQKVGFASEVVQQGLNTAGALIVPANTTKILSGLAGAVGATKGFYDSEIVVAKTIQIAQGQMRALRDEKAKWILDRMALPAAEYPLSLALHDLEDYYRAGTLAAGLIRAVGEAEASAAAAAKDKEATVTVRFAPVTDLGRRILAYSRSSPQNRAAVSRWIEENTGLGSLPVFLRSNRCSIGKLLNSSEFREHWGA